MGGTLFLGDWGEDGEYTGENDFPYRSVAAVIIEKATEDDRRKARADLESSKNVHVSWWDGHCHRSPLCRGRYLIFEGHAEVHRDKSFYVWCSDCNARHIVEVLEKNGNSYRFSITLDQSQTDRERKRPYT